MTKLMSSSTKYNSSQSKNNKRKTFVGCSFSKCDHHIEIPAKCYIHARNAPFWQFHTCALNGEKELRELNP